MNRVEAARQRYQVRDPVPEDADAMGRVHVEVWQRSYRGLLPDALLDELDQEGRAVMWRRTLEERAAGAEGARHRGRTVVAVERSSGDLVALAAGGPARDEDAPLPLELYMINVAPEHHGTRLADLLVEAVVGDRDCYLWVLEGNARAAAFYHRLGFADDGGRKPYTRRGAAATEVRMSRRLAPTPPGTSASTGRS